MNYSNLKSLLDTTVDLCATQTNEVLLSEHNTVNLRSGKKTFDEISDLHNFLIRITQKLAQIKNECGSKVAEIDLDLNHRVESAYIYNTINNMLSYTGRSKQLVENTEKVNEDKKPAEDKSKKDTARVLIREIGYYGKFPQVKSLQDIPPMFYWICEGDNQGLYCSPARGVYVKVPFPEIVDNARDFSRARSICCKYGTKENCTQRRHEVAQYKGTETRVCNFTHKGEHYVKISTASRCPSNPCFGSPASLANDLIDISISDVKQLMLYGINDIAIASIWFDYKKNTTAAPTPQVFNSLETCTGLD